MYSIIFSIVNGVYSSAVGENLQTTGGVIYMNLPEKLILGITFYSFSYCAKIVERVVFCNNI
jgi:hypothetical protein